MQSIFYRFLDVNLLYKKSLRTTASIGLAGSM